MPNIQVRPEAKRDGFDGAGIVGGDPGCRSGGRARPSIQALSTSDAVSIEISIVVRAFLRGHPGDLAASLWGADCLRLAHGVPSFWLADVGSDRCDRLTLLISLTGRRSLRSPSFSSSFDALVRVVLFLFQILFRISSPDPLSDPVPEGFQISSLASLRLDG
jgi:hypothetical protein